MIRQYTEWTSASGGDEGWIRLAPFRTCVSFAWPDVWPFHDFHLIYFMPGQANYRLRFLSRRASATYERAVQTGGLRETRTDHSTEVELTAGFRARVVGRYFGIDPAAWSQHVVMEYRREPGEH